ncbi:MAG: hypothetical protein FWE29_05885 [Defluviitaleaceae bacterium]|nr:hypothetical protein [Defluviitaleaceae bacterium]
MNRERILWITRTAIFIALLVSAQAFTRPMGQIVTGSSVNFVLVAASILGGLSSAAVVAVLSPVFAFLIIGIPVFPQIIPFIMLGNFALVAAFCLIAGKSFNDLNTSTYIRICGAAIVGSVLKFLVLWVGVTQVALRLIPDIMPPQVAAMTVAFSWPQLTTALIGSAVAIAVMPVLVRVMKYSKSEALN